MFSCRPPLSSGESRPREPQFGWGYGDRSRFADLSCELFEEVGASDVDRAILPHMDNQATTPSQHALIQLFAQQPQTVVVPVVPAW